MSGKNRGGLEKRVQEEERGRGEGGERSRHELQARASCELGTGVCSTLSPAESR